MEAYEKELNLFNVKNPENVLTLIKSGADLNATDENGRTPLINAIIFGRIQVIKIFLENGANPNARTRDDNTPLHIASICVNLEVFKMLLEFGADPNAQDSNGDTPLITLMLASLEFSAKFLKILLEKRLHHKPTNTYSDGAELIEILLDYREYSSVPVLDRAETVVINRNLQVFDLLLEKGADLNIKNANGETLPDIVKRYGGQELMDLLIKYEASLKKTRS